MYELAKDSGNWTLLGEGHYSKPEDGAGGELWGLAPHPTNPDIFATSGDDATVRIWSISQVSRGGVARGGGGVWGLAIG